MYMLHDTLKKIGEYKYIVFGLALVALKLFRLDIYRI